MQRRVTLHRTWRTSPSVCVHLTWRTQDTVSRDAPRSPHESRTQVMSATAWACAWAGSVRRIHQWACATQMHVSNCIFDKISIYACERIIDYYLFYLSFVSMNRPLACRFPLFKHILFSGLMSFDTCPFRSVAFDGDKMKQFSHANAP